MKIQNLKNYTLSIDLSKSYKVKVKGAGGKELADETGTSLLIIGRAKRNNLPKEISDEKEIKKLVADKSIKIGDDDAPEPVKKKKLSGGNS